MLKQIDFLLKENTQIMDMAYKIGSRLEKLEKKAGIDKPQESLYKNFDNQKSGEESVSESGSKSQSQSQPRSQGIKNEMNVEGNNEEGEEQKEI